MHDSDLKQIYVNLIAGRLPVGSGSPLKVVSNQVYAILGTDRLHIHLHVRNNYVYYFAIESRHLGSHRNFALPFTNVLPDCPGHQGDGIYLYQSPDFSAALVIEAGSVRLMCNTPDVLQDYLLGLELPTYAVSDGVGKHLESVPQAILGVSDKLGVLINRVSIGVLAVCALVFVGVHATKIVALNMDAPQLNVRAVENDLNATLNKLSVQQPLAMQLSRIQQVSATVIRSGGWIQRYTMGNHDKKEAFEIMLPSWVSQDYLDQLGRDVVTDLRDMEGLLIVRKQGKGK